MSSNFKAKNEEWLFPSKVFKNDNEYFHIDTKEPVIAGRIEKMSKSKKNVVDPQQIIENFGADTARFFMLSDSPPNRDMEWSDAGVEGSWRFLNKLWKFVISLPKSISSEVLPINLSKKNKNLISVLHKSIKDITKAIDEFHFNLAVASIRSLFNSLSSYEINDDDDKIVVIHVTKKFLILINPMVPHLAEELWNILNNKELISNEIWPRFDLNYIQKTT